MKKVIIEPGCISCGSCEFICPAVFEVTDKSYIKEAIDTDTWSEKIKEAARKCPVQVIKYEK
ncbi:ferredoxin [bacterium]|nr:MAG: ferredoxin [bacterium]QQR62162.1 MAG: ferredoxin [bacterium]QQR63282.1 MAG: ferredoxin [bacterium]